MNMWIDKHNKQYNSLTDFPENCVGFVYCITNLKTGKYYIGKKILKNTKNVKISARELRERDIVKGRKPSKKTVISESDWAAYYGSNKPLKEDLKVMGANQFKREILQLCYSRKQMSYYELKFQFVLGVLENPELSYNENVAGKFFIKDLL